MTRRIAKLTHGAIFSTLLGCAGFSFADELDSHYDYEESADGGVVVVGSAKVHETAASLRDLWLDHAFWVRAIAAETFAGNEQGADAAELAAAANSRQMVAFLEPFYGRSTADEISALLAGHYGAVSQYLNAVKDQKPGERESGRLAMVANAEQLASFLSDANPHLRAEALRGLLFVHGGHHIEQIQRLSQREYLEEAKIWEEMKSHVYAIADSFAVALASQFPERFK